MKNLPDIGSSVLLKIDSEKQVVTIIAHFQDKAVYVYKTSNQFDRVDMATAYNFEPVPVYKPLEYGKSDKTGCAPGNHNYIPFMTETTHKAVCSRCGNTINLE